MLSEVARDLFGLWYFGIPTQAEEKGAYREECEKTSSQRQLGSCLERQGAQTLCPLVCRGAVLLLSFFRHQLDIPSDKSAFSPRSDINSFYVHQCKAGVPECRGALDYDGTGGCHATFEKICEMLFPFQSVSMAFCILPSILMCSRCVDLWLFYHLTYFHPVCFFATEMLGPRLWPSRSNAWMSSEELQEDLPLPLCRQVIGLCRGADVGWLRETGCLQGPPA